MFGDLERTKVISYSAAFIGLIALGSWISVPVGSVPVTLQTLFILLAGVVLHRYGAITVFLYVLLGTLGLPLFHNGTAGPGVLLGPTGGYLIGFIAAAGVTGLAYESDSAARRIAGLVAGILLIYVFGVAWLMISLGIGLVAAIATGVLPFIVFDFIKAGAAYIIGQRIG